MAALYSGPAPLAPIAASSLLGNPTGSSAASVAVGLGSGLSFDGADLTASGGGGGSTYTPTGVKTGPYTAAAGEFVPVDTTSGAVTITLPTAPADKTRVAIKIIAQTGTNAVTFAAGGSDVFNAAGGATSGTLKLLSEAVEMQYAASSAIWYVFSNDVPISGTDLRYVPRPLFQVTGPGTAIASTNAATSIFTGAALLTGTSLTLPANRLIQGSLFSPLFFGTIKVTGTPTLTTTISLGGTTIAIGTSANLSAGGPFYWTLGGGGGGLFQVQTGGATGKIIGIDRILFLTGGSVGVILTPGNANAPPSQVTLDFTGTLAFDIKFTFSVSDANNTAQLLGGALIQHG